MNELKKESKDKHKSEKSHRNSESKTSKASKKEGEEGKVNKEHKHKDKSSDKSKSKHKDNSEPKEEKSKVKVEVEKSKPNVAENPVLRLSSKSPSKQLLRISTENLAPSQDRTQENSPREYVVRRGLPESDSPQPLTKNNSSPNLLSDQEAENVPKSPQGIILRSFSSGKQDNVVNGDVNSSSTIASTSVPSASRIRIVGNRPAVKQNNVYYSCPTKKLMENPPPKTSSSRYGTMHIPTDAEEQEAANKLNEHSYANSRVRDKLMDEDLKITKDEVKVSDFAGVNSSLAGGSNRPAGLEVKRVKQHKKLGSDGIADLKKLYQVERQQQAEIFLLDFISSDESLDPITKAQLIVKCLNQWQFGLDLMNNIIKSCESSMEAHQFSKKKIFSWATTHVCIWYFSQPESKYQLVPADIHLKSNFKSFIKKVESSTSKAFEHTWSHFLSNMDPLWKQSIIECLRNSIDTIQHYSSLEETIQKLIDYSTIVKESFVFPGIERQFFGRIFQWVLNTLVSILKKDGSSSLQGIQMRIIITEIMEFSRKIGYHDIAKNVLRPANEICNMLCYQKKHLFCDKKEREDVCPTLSPWLMAEVLENYKHTKEEIAISKSYLDQLRSLGEPMNEIIQPYKPLEFNFEILPHPEFPSPIVFPSQFVEHPGFEFLL